MNNTIIAPLATAIWLIDNTSLTFKQIGDSFEKTQKILSQIGVEIS